MRCYVRRGQGLFKMSYNHTFSTLQLKENTLSAMDKVAGPHVSIIRRFTVVCMVAIVNLFFIIIVKYGQQF